MTRQMNGLAATELDQPHEDDAWQLNCNHFRGVDPDPQRVLLELIMNCLDNRGRCGLKEINRPLRGFNSFANTPPNGLRE